MITLSEKDFLNIMEQVSSIKDLLKEMKSDLEKQNQILSQIQSSQFSPPPPVLYRDDNVLSSPRIGEGCQKKEEGIQWGKF